MDKQNSNSKIIETIYTGILVLLSLLFLTLVIYSFRWRMVHDYPILLYISYAMNHFHLLPYRDIYDMNLPGTYFLYGLIGRIFGYSDIGSRWADIVYLTAISAVTFGWARKLGNRVAWSSVLLFGWMYLRWGAMLSLQREYLMILPISSALLFSVCFPKMKHSLRYLLLGICFGLCSTIKFQSIIGFPFVLVFTMMNEEITHPPKRLQNYWWGILGCLLPILFMVFYLVMIGVWGNFVDIVNNFWPLYSQISNGHQILRGESRITYLFGEYVQLGGQSIWLIPMLLGIIGTLYCTSITTFQKKLLCLLIILLVAYSLYPVLSGQFWTYHWLIYFYFLSIISSLCWVEFSSHIPPKYRILPPIILIGILYINCYPTVGTFYKYIRYSTLPPKNGRVDEITGYLKTNLKPGDKVQPLDWTGGAVHGMLMAHAEIATPYIYDFYFYQNSENDYIQSLRTQFINSLGKSKPRFIIQITAEDKPWVSGEGTSRRFPGLEDLLARDYKIACHGNGFLIYERIIVK